jgi:hypothetical protein
LEANASAFEALERDFQDVSAFSHSFTHSLASLTHAPSTPIIHSFIIVLILAGADGAHG